MANGNRMKRAIRARMEVTGEKYTQAMRALQAEIDNTYFEVEQDLTGDGKIIRMRGKIYDTATEEFRMVDIEGTDWIEDFDLDQNRHRWTDRATGKSVYLREPESNRG